MKSVSQFNRLLNALFIGLSIYLSTLIIVSQAVAGSLSEIPPPAPWWWGSSVGQTASLYADFSEEGLNWDDSIIGDNLQESDFHISVVDMVWVDDPILGKGYQSASPGEMIFEYDNLLVVTNKKNLVAKLNITPDDFAPTNDDIIVEADWGGGWMTGGLGSIKFTWSYDPDTAILDINGVITPQPNKVRVKVKVPGGSGPLIKQGWAGEHCEPIPLPSTLSLSVLGTLLFLIFRRNNGAIGPINLFKA